jgi:hypothetical protein
MLMRGDRSAGERFETEYGVKGVGSSVRASWAESFPEFLRTNDNGYAAPEKCLAAHLLREIDDEVHLEVCNASFDQNVTQRLKGAVAREAYEEVLDPRGVQLWVDGTRDEEALSRLSEGSLAFPTLPAALEMLGLDEEAAGEAADVLKEYRATQSGTTVRGDVV